MFDGNLGTIGGPARPPVYAPVSTQQLDQVCTCILKTSFFKKKNKSPGMLTQKCAKQQEVVSVHRFIQWKS